MGPAGCDHQGTVPVQNTMRTVRGRPGWHGRCSYTGRPSRSSAANAWGGGREDQATSSRRCGDMLAP